MLLNSSPHDAFQASGAEQARPSLSVIITCYNYGRFLPSAIDSILREDVGAQIIVVDDCSSDNSREVMLAYGDKITPVFQPHNQGHAAAFNAGWERATGDLIYFLDADDFVLPGELKRALGNYEPGVLIYHYRMRYADDHGQLAGVHPALQYPLAIGDISRQLREQGRYHTNVTSGLIFARDGLDKVMPIPAEAYRMSAEGYIVSALPLYGPTRTFESTLSAYRLHSAQNWKPQTDLGARARRGLNHDFHRYAAIRDHAARLGLPVADDLGDADILHLNDRLISMSFAPDQHPIARDSIARVIRLAKRYKPENVSARMRLAHRIWWTLMSILPAGSRRTLLRWKIDPASRPKWLISVGRFLRRRLGVVVN